MICDPILVNIDGFVEVPMFTDFHAFLMKYQSEIDTNMKKGWAGAWAGAVGAWGRGWPGLAVGASQ